MSLLDKALLIGGRGAVAITRYTMWPRKTCMVERADPDHHLAVLTLPPLCEPVHVTRVVADWIGLIATSLPYHGQDRKIQAVFSK